MTAVCLGGGLGLRGGFGLCSGLGLGLAGGDCLPLLGRSLRPDRALLASGPEVKQRSIGCRVGSVTLRERGLDGHDRCGGHELGSGSGTRAGYRGAGGGGSQGARHGHQEGSGAADGYRAVEQRAGRAMAGRSVATGVSAHSEVL